MSEARYHIVLYQPVIPQNTGAIARLCACTGARLHLIHPLGFRTDEASVKRAGLDYWDHVGVMEYPDWEAFARTVPRDSLRLFTKFAETPFTQAPASHPTYFVFGSETRGIPDSLWRNYRDRCYRIPMRTHLVRSLNLAQSAAIALYEQLRRDDFPDLLVPPPPRLGST